MRARLKRIISLILIPIYLQGCAEWTSRSLDAASLSDMKGNPPEKARLVLVDSSQVKLERVVILSDGIGGQLSGGLGAPWRKVPLDSIATMSTAPSTVRVVLGLLGVAAFTVFLLSIIQPEHGKPYVAQPWTGL